MCEREIKERGEERGREIFGAADGEMKVLIMAYGSPCVFVLVCL